MKKEGNSEIQDTLDPNTIDNRSPEKAICIFGSYKRYKNKKEKKESRLLKTPIKRRVDKFPKKIDVYYYHKWSLTICDGCFDTLKSSKMRS